jgi:protein TonB
MILLKQIYSGVAAGIFFSTLIHAGVGGGLYYTLKRRPAPPIVAELDLSMTSLLPSSPAPPPPPAGGPGSTPAAEAAPGPPRTVAKKQAASSPPAQEETPAKPEGMIAPVISGRPSEILEIPETSSTEEAAPALSSSGIQEADEGARPAGEAVSVAAAGPGEPGGVSGGEPGGTRGGEPGGVPGGTPGGAGRYLSASEVARPPRWVGNQIGPGDYPRKARRKGKDGRVVLSVFIDEVGRVRDVRLLQGTDDVLNEVALRKVREAVFTPAYNEAGKSVACKVTLPIRFQLE